MNIYADKGTAAHTVLENCLIAIYSWGMEARAADHIGQMITVRDIEHEELSPSGGDRWMACPGSRQMQRPFKKTVDSSPRQIEFTQEYAAAVQEILDHVKERVHALTETLGEPPLVYAERRVSQERLLGTRICQGTVDVTLVGGLHREIIDAKFGAGVPVMADSKQLDLYLLGVLSEEDPDLPIQTARLTIAQPRCSKVTPTIRWRDIDDVSSWQEDFISQARRAIEATEQEPPILRPSEDACRWCEARGVCAASAEFALQSAGVTMKPLPRDSAGLYDEIERFALLEPSRLTPGQLCALLDGTEILRATLDAVNAFALEAVLTGRAPDEISNVYKVVRRDSRRRWAQEEQEIEKRLKRIKIEDPETGKKRGLGKKDLTENRLKSPAAVEKLLKIMGVPAKDARFDAFRALVDKPEGALTLVPISDTRPAVQTARSPEKAFEGGPDVEVPDHRFLT